jgi:hypothetical protein
LIAKAADKRNKEAARYYANPPSKQFTRLLKTREERDAVRSQKRMQVIDLRSVYKKGNEVWMAMPRSFLSFARGQSVFEDEIQKAKEKASRFHEIGCISMYQDIMQGVEAFRQQQSDTYYRFNRVTLTNVAMILAKASGYRMAPSPSMLIGETGQRLIVPQTIFGEYSFQYDGSPFERSAFRTAVRSSNLVYEPKVYPLHDMWGIATDNVRKIVEHLEAFPEACGKAIFDNYLVVVPGVSYPIVPAEHNDEYCFRNRSGQVQHYKSREDACQSLDCILVHEKLLCPVLVGEKDGRCYFISYWE